MACSLEGKMSYIWENYSSDKKYILENSMNIPEETSCIYDEMIFNYRIRFSDIFRQIELNEKNNSKSGKDIYNITAHYLAQMDLISGRLRYDTAYSLLTSEIMSGRFGEEVKQIFSGLENNDKLIILNKIIKYHKTNNRKDFFKSVFFEMFGDAYHSRSKSAEIYYNRTQNKYYCFCSVNKSEQNIKRFRIAKLLFLDVSLNAVAIWGDYCFGIISGKGISAPVIGCTKIIEE